MKRVTGGYDGNNHISTGGSAVTLLPYARAAGIGAVSGLRTFSGPAATLAFGDSAWTGLVTTLAAGECLGDKLPFTPSRMSPPALIGRMFAGGICGGALVVRRGGGRLAGIAIGAAAAVAGAWLGYTIRRYLTTELGLPDAPIALVEDAVAIAGARAAASA